jgi:hypothetical protein
MTMKELGKVIKENWLAIIGLAAINTVVFILGIIAGKLIK